MNEWMFNEITLFTIFQYFVPPWNRRCRCPVFSRDQPGNPSISQIPTRSKLHKYSYIYSHRYWLTFYDVVKSLQMTSGSLIVRWLKTRNCLRCANLDL